MTANPKPRSDTPLHRLTPEPKQAVIDYLQAHRLVETVIEQQDPKAWFLMQQALELYRQARAMIEKETA